MTEQPHVIERLAATQLLITQALLLLALLSAFALIALDGHGIAYPDEGLYAAQAQSLSRGGWAEQSPAQRLPNVEALNGLGPEWVHHGHYIGYVRHSVYMRLLAPFFGAWGFAGLLVPSVLAGALASLAAALLARRLDPRLAAPALWMTGIGTPLIFDSLLVAAHALAAASFGWAVVGLAKGLLDRRPRHLLWTVPLLVATVWMRSEGAVAVAALGGAIGLVSLLSTRRDRRRALVGMLCGAGIIALAAVAYFVDAELARRITGSTAATQTVSRFEGDRSFLGQVWSSLLRPWYSASAPHPFVGLGSLAVVLAAVLARFLGARRPFIPLAVLTTGTICLLYSAPTTRGFITGLFAAAPLLLAGLVLLRRVDLARPMATTFLITIAATAFGIVATGYSEGGAAEWGGRFYAILLPLLVPLALLGALRAFELLPTSGARSAATLCVVVVVSIAWMAIATNAENRERSEGFNRSTIAAIDQHHATEKPLVIVGGVAPGGAARILWDQRDRMDVLVGPTVTATFGLARGAAESGYSEVFVVTALARTRVIEVAKVWLDPVMWHLQKVTPLGTTNWAVYRFGPEFS